VIAEPDHLKSLLKSFSRALRPSSDPTVLGSAIVALSKLLLTHILPAGESTDDMVRQLTLNFFDPATVDNQSARQALSYFLPVYCHSRKENMETMGRVVCDVLKGLLGMQDELEEEEDGGKAMVGLNAATGMMVDWTDERKLVTLGQPGSALDSLGMEAEKEAKEGEGDVHLDIATEALERSLAHGISREYRKALLSLLSKIHVVPTSSPEKLKNLHKLATDAIDAKISSEASTRNALTKLQASLEKALAPPEPAVRRVRKSMAPAAVIKEKDEGTEIVDGRADNVTGTIEDDVQTVQPEGDDDDRTVRVGGDAREDSVLDDLLNDEDTVMQDD